jgi:hypothetical protein
MLSNPQEFARVAAIAESRGMTAAHLGPTISEPLTWKQICERYPDQWVCLVEIDWAHPGDFDFRTARVVGHGSTRGEPLRQARPWRSRYKTIGHYFAERSEPVIEPVLHFIRIDGPGRLPRFYPCNEAQANAFQVRMRIRNARGGQR